MLWSESCSFIALLVISLVAVDCRRHARDAHGEEGHTHEETDTTLFDKSKAELTRAKNLHREFGKAKNVVLMVGDGLGLSTITSSRIYKGQLQGRTGEEEKLVFEDFPNVALSKVYNIDRQVPDSAGTATAMMTGVKTNYGVLGVGPEVPYGKNCSQLTDARKLSSLMDIALEEGKSVGIVTNTRITHATPGSAYAHTNNRDWESDTDMAGHPGCAHVRDIAYQLVMENPNINVALGGGWRSFILNNVTKPPATKPNSHQRSDGLDLIEAWKTDKSSRGLKHAYVGNTGQLKAVDPQNVDYLFGLFSSSHMDYEAFRNKTDAGQPSLAYMVEKALEILKKNPNGFFLLVEGGRIDHAHHDTRARLALAETLSFEAAVQTVMDHTSEQDTLLTVTADHSHVFTMGGYPSRGNDILGLVDWYPPGESTLDGMPYTTLSYSNGPNARMPGQNRTNLTDVDTRAFDYLQSADIPIQWESHGGEDVAIYSRGPMSHLFHTTHEQSYIAQVMMYSACIGEYGTHNKCDMTNRLLRQALERGETTGNTAAPSGGVFCSLATFFVLLVSLFSV